MKVIHIPTTVGGNPQGISKHLNDIGITSETWSLSQNYFNYKADKILLSDKTPLLLAEILKISSLRYIFQCDAVFFNYGRGVFQPFVPVNVEKIGRKKAIIARIYGFYSFLMSHIEVGLLSFLRKPILIQYQGDDARQGDFSRTNFDISIAHNVDELYYPPASDRARRQAIGFFGERASRIYALNPDLLHVLPSRATFLPYSHVNMNEWQFEFEETVDRPIRLCHAPSHRGAKGTDKILEALDSVKSSGLEFELVLVEGKSNTEAKEIYKTVDVVIDQLYAGWYGGVAVEAMALGKPVVAYIRHQDLAFIPRLMRDELPIIEANTDNIREVLENIIKMSRNQLREKAVQSRSFVEKWHDPYLVAENIKSDLLALLPSK